MRKSVRSLIIGHLVIDKNITESGIKSGPGGASFFGAKFLENIGSKPVIVSPYGKDFPKEIFSVTDIYPPQPTHLKSFIFRNILTQSGRKQRIENKDSGNYCLLSLPDKLFRNNDLVFFAPLIDNWERKTLINWLDKSKRSLKILEAQGLFRQIKDDQTIIPKKWTDIELVRSFNIIVVSQKDYPGIESLASKWSSLGPLVIVTRAQFGCTIYLKDKKIVVPAFRIDKIVDSTGAGDIFTASFAYAYFKTKEIEKSAVFANAAAGLSLRFYSDRLEYKYQDIINLTNSQERSIEI